MSLPTVLSTAALLWTPAPSLAPASPSCGLARYQPASQCQTFWCWAAVLQQLLLYIDGTQTNQCDLATRFIAATGPCCPCDPTVYNPCNQLGTLRDYLDNLNLEYDFVSGPGLTQPVLQAALCASRPVVGMFKNIQLQHYVVISGITPATPQYSLEVCNPDLGTRTQILCQDGQPIALVPGLNLTEAYILKGQA